MDREQVEGWLDSGVPGWDVDEVPSWLSKGRSMGSGVIPVLKELRSHPLSAFRTRAVRIAWNEFVELHDGGYYPYYWEDHVRVRSEQELLSLPPDSRFVTLAPPPATRDFGAFAEGLDRLSKIESLRLESGNPDTLSFLAGASGLQNLELPNMQRFAVDLSACAGLSALRYLRIAGAPKAKNVDVLGELVELKSLTLIDLPPVLTCIPPLDKLEFLTFGASSETDLAPIQSMTSLRHLKLDKLKRLTNLTSLGSSVSALRSIRLSFCRQLADLSALSGADRLRKLRIRGLPRLVQADWLESLSHLEELHISKCSKLREMSPVGTLGQLKQLALSEMGALPSLDFLSNLKELRHLDLTVTRIGDRSYEPLYALDKLLTLDAWRLGEDQIEALRRALPQCIFNNQEAFARDPQGQPG